MPQNNSLITDISDRILNKRDDNFRIFLINGMFGVGKTYNTDNICNIVSANGNHGLIRFNFADSRFLLELPGSFRFTDKYVELNEKIFPGNEIAYNQQMLYDLLDKVNAKDPEAFLTAWDMVSLKTVISQKINESEKQSKLASLAPVLLSVSDKKSSINFFSDVENITSEAFAADLMNSFYPDVKNKDQESIDNKEAIPLLFVFDNYDNIAGSVNSWLGNSFFNYCYNKQFNEYKYYDISHAGDDACLSDYFDIKFILTGRDNSPDLFNGFLTCGKEYFKCLELKPFTKQETKECIETGGQSVDDENLNRIYQYTNGIPLLICSLAQNSNLSGTNDFTYLSARAYTEIFKYMTDKEKKWIICSSYLDDFTEIGLKCFADLECSASEVFDYLKSSAQVIENTGNNKIKINSFISSLVKKEFPSEMPAKAIEYEKAAKVYAKVKPLFDGLNYKESEAARNLAYFERFDQDYAIDKAYQNNSEIVKDIMKKRREWFCKDKFSFCLKSEIKEILLEFNVFADSEKYEEKKHLVSLIWNEFRQNMLNKISELEKEAAVLESQSAVLEKKIHEGKKKYNENQVKYMDLENTLIEVRKKLSYFSPGSYMSFAGINFFVSLLVLGAALFLPQILDIGTNHTAVNTSKNILFIITAIFASVGLLHIGRLVYMRTKKKDRETLIAKKRETEELREEYLQKMKDIKDNGENSQKTILEIQEKIRRCNAEISEIKERLEYPYISTPGAMID